MSNIKPKSKKYSSEKKKKEIFICSVPHDLNYINNLTHI